MDCFTHSFVNYEGICTHIPTHLECFSNFFTTFTVPISYKTWPIYTLHKVTLMTNPSYIDDHLCFILPLTFVYQYTVKDLTHTMHTTTYPYLFRAALPFTPTSSVHQFYIENLFAYCLDNCHIYTAISLIVTFSNKI